MTGVDWDSIREVDGLKVGDPVHARGPEVGFIRNLIWVKGRYRARVYWPTIPFESEGRVSADGSEQFIDLGKLSRAPEQSNPLLTHESGNPLDVRR